jgi:hypothetical protein
MSSDTMPAEASAPASLPLFYKNPEPLRADLHAPLRLSVEPDFRFAADTNAVPIMAGEFIAAGRFYPIVFAGDPVMPAAVLGLETRNLFVADNGAWAGAPVYIPAYVRRYPFTFIQQDSNFILGIDLACSRLLQGGKDYKNAQPLFVDDGQPSPLIQESLRFCSALQADHMVTREFAAALKAQNLLIEQNAQAVSEHGRQYRVQGFSVVDAARFQALPDTTLLEWHRKGWLALVHAHLASLLAWKDLVGRVGAREGQPETAN